MPKKINQNIRKIISRYLKEVNKELPVEYGIIFGSYTGAQGRVHRGSDIDICVVSSAFKGKKGFELETALWRIGRKVDLRIEPVGYRKEDLKTGGPLASQILESGVRVT